MRPNRLFPQSVPAKSIVDFKPDKEMNDQVVKLVKRKKKTGGTKVPF